MLFDTLKESDSKVFLLSMSNNQIDDDCMKSLSEYIAKNQHLEILNTALSNISDKGIEILLECVIGNTTLKDLNFWRNKGLTDASAPYLLEIAKHSHITRIVLDYTAISHERREEIRETLLIPVDQREIPIKSKTKSAAKASA